MGNGGAISGINKNNGKSPIFLFEGSDDLNVEHMQPFGRMGFVTIRTKLKKKLANRSFKAY